jgi:hypothetical protein
MMLDLYRFSGIKDPDALLNVRNPHSREHVTNAAWAGCNYIIRLSAEWWPFCCGFAGLQDDSGGKKAGSAPDA